jgi:meiotically up-regulated gene 157 (Mug157) protein
MAAVELEYLTLLLSTWNLAPDIQEESRFLSNQIREAIQKHGVIQHPIAGKIYAYEIDGFGSCYCMDVNDPFDLFRLSFS